MTSSRPCFTLASTPWRLTAATIIRLSFLNWARWWHPRTWKESTSTAVLEKKLYSTQEKINRSSRYVTVLSHPAKDLWRKCLDRKNQMLIVPGGVDSDIPPPGVDPYPERRGTRCLFAGHVYTRSSQPEANKVLIMKLNELGKLLAGRGARLYMLGSGDVRRLNRNHVTYLGTSSYHESWDYFHFADVGIVVSAGVHHNNESSKIYHYLRAGLPVVSEAGFPNDNVVCRVAPGIRNGERQSGTTGREGRGRRAQKLES